MNISLPPIKLCIFEYKHEKQVNNKVIPETVATQIALDYCEFETGRERWRPSIACVMVESTARGTGVTDAEGAHADAAATVGLETRKGQKKNHE